MTRPRSEPPLITSSPRELFAEDTTEIGQVYQERLKEFQPHVITVGDWPELSDAALSSNITESSSARVVADVTESLESDQPVHLVCLEVETEADWQELTPLYLVKSIMAVAREGMDAADQSLLRSQLEQQLGSAEAAQYVMANPRALPYVVIKTDNPTVSEKLMQIGGIDAVVSAEDDIATVMQGVKAAAYARENQPDFWQSEKQERTMLEVQQGIDLMALEERTANTQACLEHLSAALQQHEAETGQRIETVLECGAGEGRVAIPLILMGYRVIGVELNEDRLQTAQQRLLDEARVFVASQPPIHGTLARLAWDLLPADRRAAQVENIQQELDQLEDNYGGFTEDQQATLFMPDRFHPHPGNFNRMSGIEFKMVTGHQPEAAVFAWNTLNFTGSPAQIVRVLGRVRDSLADEGLLFIESADRTTGPYPQVLQEYAETHPRDIPGTTVSYPPSQGEALYVEGAEKAGVRRYFPSAGEMEHLLAAAGFELVTMQRYSVEPQGDDVTDESKEANGYDELVYIARKR